MGVVGDVLGIVGGRSTSHFKHYPGSSCTLSTVNGDDDTDSSVDEQRRHQQTPWHRTWSLCVIPMHREVMLHGRPRDAALPTSSCIVEFQHSRMTLAELRLRCMAPILNATWIFDVTNHLPWRCEDTVFIDLPSAKFDWAYSADASLTLLFHASDDCLYEAISEPIRIFLDSKLHLVRAVSCFDPSRLPEVFREGEVQAFVAQSSNSRPMNVELILNRPVSDAARRHLPLQAQRVDAEMEQPRRDQSTDETNLAECKHVSHEESQATADGLSAFKPKLATGQIIQAEQKCGADQTAQSEVPSKISGKCTLYREESDSNYTSKQRILYTAIIFQISKPERCLKFYLKPQTLIEEQTAITMLDILGGQPETCLELKFNLIGEVPHLTGINSRVFPPIQLDPPDELRIHIREASKQTTSSTKTPVITQTL